MQEKTKETLKMYKSYFAQAVITGFIFMIIISTTIILSKNFSSEVQGIFMNQVSPDYKNDSLSNMIAYRCAQETKDTYKVYCVNKIVDSFFRYDYHRGNLLNTNNTYYLYLSPEETLLNGGICRDAANTYCNIFDKMNISCRIEVTTDHAFSLIDLGNGTFCTADQGSIYCDEK